MALVADGAPFNPDTAENFEDVSTAPIHTMICKSVSQHRIDGEAICGQRSLQASHTVRVGAEA